MTSERAFWQLYDEALPHVYGYLLRRTSKGVAEDLTQEVFTTAARAAVSETASVTVPWLLTVARSRLIDHVRAEQRAERKLALAWSARSDEETIGVEEIFEAAQLQPATEHALGTLPTAQRAALLLHHVDGLSVAEVAAALERSVRATESLLARARRAFRLAFEEAVDE